MNEKNCRLDALVDHISDINDLLVAEVDES